MSIPIKQVHYHPLPTGQFNVFINFTGAGFYSASVYYKFSKHSWRYQIRIVSIDADCKFWF